jgi:hypothetical protein
MMNLDLCFRVPYACRHSVRPLERGLTRRNGARYTGQHKHRTDVDKHQRLEWDSNSRSQCLSRRRQFMPQTSASRVDNMAEKYTTPGPSCCFLVRTRSYRQAQNGECKNVRHFDVRF